MTTRTHFLSLFAAALLSSFVNAAAARADVGLPVSVELLGEPRAGRPGEVFAGELRITSGDAAEVADLRLEGEGWRPIRIGADATMAFRANESRTVTFAAECVDASHDLVVSFLWNGRRFREHLDLSERAARYARERFTVSMAREEGAEPPSPPGIRLDAPAPRQAEDAAAKSPAPPQVRRAIRVRGRFVYTRPDGVTLGVDGLTAHIYDSDPGIDDHLVDVATGSDGRFDITFDFDDAWENYPDIYVNFEAANAEAEVEHPTWGYIYSWETGVYADIASELNLGTIHSGDEDVVPALHLITSMTRNWRWFEDYAYDPRYVEVEWPDGDEGAWYTDIDEEIHISTEHEWSDQVPCHEHGHHWMHNFDETPDPEYCNGICDDDPPSDCGHCIWCEEDSHIAWSEGFSDYLAYAIPMGYRSRYGTSPADTISVQALSACSWPDFDPPEITEGFVAAVLVDIHDAETGESHPHYPGYFDQLNMDSEEILACADVHNPTTVMGFLHPFRDDNAWVKENLWETAANCGFDIDEAAPGAPTSLYCESHDAGVASPDATVEMAWVRPDDDASGVDAYSFDFFGLPALPNTIVDGTEPSCVSPALSPGTYYFCVRARDRAGNWSASYASWGPIVIREAEPSNLTEAPRAGWDYPVVPRSTTGASGANCQVTATLTGGGSTYWNVSGQNDGESATSATFLNGIYIDGVLKDDASSPVIAAGAAFYDVNNGPFSVYGGRHVLHAALDSGEDIAETNENDNTWGHQFVWTPAHLTPGAVVSQPGMEHALAGLEHIHDGSTLWLNCRGLRFDNSAWWNACVVWPHDNDQNYDIRMHLASTGAENGFTTPLVSSSRSFGCLDAVLVNRNSVATAEYDVGVVFYGVYTDLGYDVVHVENQDAGFDEATVATLAPDEWLAIYEFYVGAEQVGPVSVVVRTSPPTAGVHAQWRAEDFVTGGLSTCDAEAITNAEGEAILEFTVPETGYNSVCFFRDPKDGDAPVDVTFTIRKTPADLAPYWAAGWYSPLVPRRASDGTPTSVPAPDTLIGNVDSTYYNVAIQNSSAGDADSARAYIWIDGAAHAGLLYPTVPGGATRKYNYTFPYVVRGGRHSLSLNIDAYNTILELNEQNNVFGEQFVWSPYSVAQGSTIARVAPPPMTGGWNFVTTGGPLWYDCDGLRMSGLSGWWAAMAVMPGDTSNVDLRLHPPLAGAKNGFASNLAYSSWGKGSSDYVLVNFNLVARRSQDVGVVAVDGAQFYTAECVREDFLTGSLPRTFGPFVMTAGTMIDLHEIYLIPGLYAVELRNAAGNVDWGICLHPADQAYLKKSITVPEGAAWLAGAGMDESFTVSVADSGFYCFAVWKSGAADLSLEGTYKLAIDGWVTAVEAGAMPPRQTAIVSIAPNPFNPHTTIAFDLASASRVRLMLYDVSGALVRTLVDERRPAGRFGAIWDGRDAHGRATASGVYIARIEAGAVSDSRKLVLLR